MVYREAVGFERLINKGKNDFFSKVFSGGYGFYVY